MAMVAAKAVSRRADGEALQEEIEKLREEGELPEVLDIIRHIERAGEKLQKPPTKNWIH